MSWQDLSNVSNVITIVGTLCSGYSWYKTRDYYKKISKSHNFEKLSSLDRDLSDIRELYNMIHKFHFMIERRGINSQDIINYHLKILHCLDRIRNTTSSRYGKVIESVNSAKDKINMICEKTLYYENNVYFKELGTYLTNIEDGIKVEKENIRGF